jgi:Ca-activated chloride channel family protein
MNAQFVNPWMLYFLWLVPAVVAWWAIIDRRREGRLSRFVSAHMQKKLRPGCSSLRQGWQAGMLLAGILLSLIAAARPQWGMREELVYERGRDLVIALDVSRSMLANDVRPNRLQRAKADIMDLVKELRGDRAALLAFRHKAALLCPLTTDYAYLRLALDAVDVGSAPRGETDIGDAITKALEVFENDEGAHKAIILISDGEDLSGNALEVAGKAAEKEIPIFTVGLGDRRGSRIPDPEAKRGYARYQGKDILTSLDNETLYAIAKATGGAYIPVETASMTSVTLGTLYRDHLRNIASQDLEESLQRRYIERYQLFLLPALLCFLAGTCLSRGRLAAGSQRSERPARTELRRAREIAARRAAGDLVGSEEGSPAPLKDLTPPRQETRNIMTLLALGLAAWTAAAAPTNVPAAATNAVKRTTDVPPGREGARIAQKLYASGDYEQAAAAYLQAAAGSTRRSQRDFRYNAAVASFKAERYKEAADILRGLTSVEGEVARDASLGLGAALFRAAEEVGGELSEAEWTSRRARLLREAGQAFQQAARAESKDERVADRNLAVVLRELKEAEQEAKIAGLMSRYEKSPSGRIAAEMLRAQRKVNKDMLAAFTNESPSRIKQMEGAAKQQSAVADLWIPLKGKLLAETAQQPGTNQPVNPAQLEQVIEATRASMVDAAEALKNLEPEAERSARTAEIAVYQLWKSIAAFPELLREDIRLQTNIIDLTAAPLSGERERLGREAGQNEAADLTGLFAQRFSQAVPEGGTQQAAPGGAQPEAKAESESAPQQAISAADRQKILDLAAKAAAAQKRAADLLRANDAARALPAEQTAYRMLKQIEDMLPKSQPRSQQQQQQQQQQEQQQQEQKQTGREQPQEQESQRGEQEEAREQQSEQESEPEEEQDLTPEDVKALLEKAVQREKEHEAEKRRRNRQIPMSPVDRDW